MPSTLTIQPWPDPIIDTLGYDPRSRYVETFWLPTLGPTALLLLRHLADRFDRTSGSVELTVSDTSHALGLGQRDGSSSPIVRTLTRLAQFELACDDGAGTVAVRRNLPPVNRRHVKRLPAELQAAHADWADAHLAEAPLATARRNARRLAFTLLEQGDGADHVERVLHAMGFHPSVAHESARWAYERHRAALDEAAAAITTRHPAA
ncbi:MAG TPA: hypothetical protein VFZ17_06020 [Acidimicrobiia bacterium]|nr:hypothetical protein [Acidimicrobiia bacterium]